MSTTTEQRDAIRRISVEFAMGEEDAHRLLIGVDWDEQRAAEVAAAAIRLHISWRQALIEMARAAALSEATRR